MVIAKSLDKVRPAERPLSKNDSLAKEVSI
jgi:hypothetical protein